MAQTGIETIFAVGGTKMQFEMRKASELRRVQNELTAQGKEIVNIIEEPITRPLGGWSQDMRIIWKTTDVEPLHTITSPQTQPIIEKVSVTSDNFDSILERIDLFLEDKEWNKAIAYCESALDFEPKNATVYLKYLLADCKCSTFEELLASNKPFEENSYFQKALRFGDEEFTSNLKESILRSNEQKELDRCQNVYDQAKELISNTNQSEESYNSICKLLKSIPGYKDADELLEMCATKAEECKKENIYNEAIDKMNLGNINGFNSAINLFKQIRGWRDSEKQILVCKQKIEEIKNKENKKRKNRERKIKIIAISVSGIIVFVTVAVLLLVTVIIPASQYKNAVDLYKAGKYSEAIKAFEVLGDYKDVDDKINECWYQIAKGYLNDENRDEANVIFEKIKGYKDSSELIHYHNYKVIDFADVTCTKGGSKTYKCNECGHSYTETFDKLGHNFSDATCTEDSKCLRCGERGDSALGHTGNAKCVRCGAVLFEPLVYTGVGDRKITNFYLPWGEYEFTFTIKEEGGAWDHSFLSEAKIKKEDDPIYVDYHFRVGANETKSQKFSISSDDGYYIQVESFSDSMWRLEIKVIS